MAYLPTPTGTYQPAKGVVFLVGMIVFGCGTYASIAELVSLFPFHHPSAGILKSDPVVSFPLRQICDVSAIFQAQVNGLLTDPDSWLA
jgi:hypothetical protein